MSFIHKNPDRIPLRNGNTVRVRRSRNSPYAGRSGVVSAIEPDDSYGAYLVQFEDGLMFRYDGHELELAGVPSKSSREGIVRRILRLLNSLVSKPQIHNHCLDEERSVMDNRMDTTH